MIDEAEQIVYHFMHYGWPSKEHQSVSLPPSNTRERKKKERVGQGENGRANSPPPACPDSLCLLQTGKATLRSHGPQLILLFLESTEGWQCLFSNMETGV